MTKNNERKIYLSDLDDEFSFSKKLTKKNISFNRVAFIFFIFVLISVIFSVKIFYYGSISKEILLQKKISKKSLVRSDFIDSDGNYLAKTVLTNNVGLNPKSVRNKKKLLIKLKLLFPDLDVENFNNKFKKGKFFYLKKKLSPEKYDQVRLQEKNL